MGTRTILPLLSRTKAVSWCGCWPCLTTEEGICTAAALLSTLFRFLWAICRCAVAVAVVVAGDVVDISLLTVWGPSFSSLASRSSVTGSMASVKACGSTGSRSTSGKMRLVPASTRRPSNCKVALH